MTSIWFQWIGDEGKELGQGICSDPWTLSVLHIQNCPLSIGFPRAHQIPCQNVPAPVRWPSALSSLMSAFYFHWPYPLRPGGRKSSCYLLQDMAEFLLVSLNCQTFVKISFLNSLKTIPVYLHNPFSARILADTLRKNQLSNQLSFGGNKWLKPTSYQSQKLL